MTTRILILMSLLLMAGCTTTATTDRLNALETKLSTVQKTADRALSLAQQAKSDASGAVNTANNAGDSAQRALEAARDAAEKAERIGTACCAVK